MTDNPIDKEANDYLVSQNKAQVAEVTKKFIADGGNPLDIMNHAFIPGISEVGDLFGRDSSFCRS